MTDCDPNPCTFRRGIQHVEEASPHTQVTASSAKPFIGSDFSYFCVRDELIPCRTTALGVYFLHSHRTVCTHQKLETGVIITWIVNFIPGSRAVC